MEIAITVLLLIVGLVLIIKGGDFFVDALIHRCDGKEEWKLLFFAWIRM